MQTTSDRLFTAWVNMVQSTIIPLSVKFRLAKRAHGVGAPSEELRMRLTDLGINNEIIWWGPMTLFPRKVQFLLDTIEANPPETVLEVGSGTSTPILAALAKKYNFPVISLENHPGSFEYVKSLLERVPGGSRVQLELRGFARRKYRNGRDYYWYNIDLGALEKQFDMVLIDGPMSSLVGRHGALPEIAPHLSAKNDIYLDDATRRHEQKCVIEWQRHFPNLVVEEVQPCRGITWMRLDTGT